MPQPVPSRAAKAAAGAAVGLLGAAYLDHKHGFSTDIKGLLNDKAFKKRMGSRVAELGDSITLYHMLELATPANEALWFEGRTWTYSELLIEVDRLAAVLQEHGVDDGSIVAVYMTNSPEMFFTMYAISKLGAMPALINAALRSQTLSHCMQIANAKLVICTPDLATHLIELSDETGTAVPCLSLNLLSFGPLVLPSDSQYARGIVQIRYEDLAAVQWLGSYTRPKRSMKDACALMYTSGTSGKPKAVSIKNFLLMVTSTPTSIDVNDSGRYFPLRTYTCLPLFHGTCLFTALFYAVGTSSTVCLGRKFSASKFSKDLTLSGATRMLYVGELCRFLLAAPPSPYDHAHACIVAHGNGLSRDVWNKFKTRFNIPEIRELYRSTEGVARFDNASKTAAGAGMIGFAGPIRRYLEDDTYVVKYDPSTEEPYRDPKTGFCQAVELGEAGEAIGRVRTMDFYNEYINNPEANKLKLIKDVFGKGDLFQRTGDLVMREKSGWIRFHDRSGDTYRWRGENVSAGEVREHISRLPNVADASVYAVKLEGYDGQAGAAGITLIDRSPTSEILFCQSLYPALRSGGLTIWQMPRLVRITKQIDTGATFKHAKEVLKARPWDPSSGEQEKTGDSLYWLNGEEYVRLDGKGWGDIREGRARL